MRFTWTLLFDGPTPEQRGEFSLEGCIAYIRKSGDLVWAPPMSQWGGSRSRQQHWISPYLYHITLDALKGHTNLIAPIRSLWLEMRREQDVKELTGLPDMPDKITTNI